MDETLISRAITESFTKDFIDSFNVDVAIAGAGPSGLISAYYLAKSGFKVAVFEKHLRVGGGMPGGGMMFNRIVFQEEAKPILYTILSSLHSSRISRFVPVTPFRFSAR